MACDAVATPAPDGGATPLSASEDEDGCALADETVAVAPSSWVRVRVGVRVRFALER